MPITKTEPEAEAFAQGWMDAWNSHDAARIAAHYHHDVEYYSPFVSRLTDAACLEGRAALYDYVATALERYPDLHFGPEHSVAAGAGSVAIVYRSVDDLLAIETLVLDDHDLVVRAHCHYSTETSNVLAATVRAGIETLDA
jgi:SnoaL-like domain